MAERIVHAWNIGATYKMPALTGKELKKLLEELERIRGYEQ